jgi:F0F1-type ATP synthase membrane subunit b/b'
MRESARRDADAEADRLRAMVRGEIEKIERAAQAEMEAAGRAARLELKVEAVRLAVTRAESLLRERVNGEAEALLIHEFVDDLAATAP